MKKIKLDKEEKALLRSVEKGEWKSVKNLDSQKKKYGLAAEQTLLKDKRINIRLSSQDLYGVQKRAIDEGIPYQTLIASVIHKYATGRLVEKNL